MKLKKDKFCFVKLINKFESGILYFITFFIGANLIFYPFIENGGIYSHYNIFIIVKLLFYAFILLSIILLLYKNHCIAYYCEIRRSQDKLLNTQKSYYQARLEEEGQARKINHDIKGHLYCLYVLIENNDYLLAKKYLEQIGNIVYYKNKTLLTGYYLTDIIANDIANRNKDIKLIWEGIFPNKTKMLDSDICAIFYNLLKNSVDAVKNIAVKEKNINIIIKVYKKTVYLTISNITEKPVIINDNVLLTTKVDKVNHGYGSQIIKDIANKYGGCVKYYCKNNIFKSEIFLLDIVL